ncbi:hypothetical protein B2G69_07330 [Methylorubrum zatmanii]|nr:phage terminase large subunit family protein [Methylorubrum zatmanii]ARO53981.1 hypothetical protein B2G69_07330 [Methylorubrum zatmanii]
MLSVPASLLGYRGAGEMAAVIRNALRPKPSLFVWQWADLRRKLNRKHSKEDGRWSTGRVPFMREPMECLSARSPVQRVVLKKGAQDSGTETANNWCGYTIDHDPSSILYVSPTLTVTKRTSARIQSMVDDDPDGLGRKILPARKAGSKNSQFEKHFPGDAIYFATAMSAATLRSTAAGKVVLDEVDAYPLDVDGEGGVVEVVEARGFTYGDQFKALLISTPGVEQTSVIEPEYKKGDQRFYFMRCPHAACGRHLHFRKEGFAWTPGRPKTVHYLCDHCGRKIVEGRHKT